MKEERISNQTLTYFPDHLIQANFSISASQLDKDKRTLRNLLHPQDFPNEAYEGGLQVEAFKVWQRFRELLAETPRKAKIAQNRLKKEIETI
jgi:hypothetical protein